MSRANLAIFEVDADGYCKCFVTQDECWVHHLKAEIKQQSMQWKHKTSLALKKAKVVALAGKVIDSVLWNAKGSLMIAYFGKGCTINGEYYANLLKQLQREI